MKNVHEKFVGVKSLVNNKSGYSKEVPKAAITSPHFAISFHFFRSHSSLESFRTSLSPESTQQVIFLNMTFAFFLCVVVVVVWQRLEIMSSHRNKQQKKFSRVSCVSLKEILSSADMKTSKHDIKFFCRYDFSLFAIYTLAYTLTFHWSD